MEKYLLLFLCLVGFCGTSASADFDYTISSTYYNGTLTLNSKSLLVTGTGIKEIVANGTSFVAVQNTLPLQTNVGGIGTIKLYNDSSATLSGGEVSRIDLSNNSALTVSGGKVSDMIFTAHNNLVNVGGGVINRIYLNGSAKAVLTGGDIGTLQIGLNISSTTPPTYTIFCDLDSLNRTYSNGVLSRIEGNWLDGSDFDIEIASRLGNPTSSFIQFIPEPATMLLLGLGGLLIRRKIR